MPTRRLLTRLPTTAASSIFLLTITFSIGASAQELLTVDAFVASVLERGLDARLAENQVATAQAQREGAGRLPNPSIAWTRESLGGGPGESQDYFIASIPLVLSGRLGLERDAADARTAAARAWRDRRLAELRYEATGAFYGRLEADARVATLRASLEQLHELEAAMVARERVGESAGYDRLRSAVEGARVQDELRAAEIRAAEAAAEVRRLLGSEEPVPAFAGELAPASLAPQPAHAGAQLESARADLRALELEAEAAALDSRAAGRGWIPDPQLSVGPQVLDLGRSNSEVGYTVGLSIPVPIFDRGQGGRAVAEARRHEAEARHAALLQAARSRLDAARLAAAGQAERLSSYRDDVVEPARQLRSSARIAYSAGGADILRLIDAESQLRAAELGLLERAREAREAESALLLLSGAFDGANGVR